MVEEVDENATRVVKACLEVHPRDGRVQVAAANVSAQEWEAKT